MKGVFASGLRAKQILAFAKYGMIFQISLSLPHPALCVHICCTSVTMIEHWDTLWDRQEEEDVRLCRTHENTEVLRSTTQPLVQVGQYEELIVFNNHKTMANGSLSEVLVRVIG